MYLSQLLKCLQEKYLDITTLEKKNVSKIRFSDKVNGYKYLIESL